MDSVEMQQAFDIRKRDIPEIVEILYPILKYRLIAREINYHLKHKQLAKAVRDEHGNICALCFAFRGNGEWSLSYYWVHPTLRGRVYSLMWYAYVFAFFGNEPVYMYTKEPFPYRYSIEPTPKRNVYQWTGFGDRIDNLKEKLSKWAN